VKVVALALCSLAGVAGGASLPERPSGQIVFSAGPLEPGKLDVYAVDADGTNLHRLTSGRGMSFDPTWSPNGGRAAFRSVRGGNEEIRVVDADGTHERNLTRHPGMDYAPAWSPDGRRIAFASARGSQVPYVWVMNADGTRPHVLTRAVTGEYPAWSPDGRRIAWAVNVDLAKNFELYAADVDGTHLRRLTRNPAYDMGPAWSPDGRWIAFYSDRGSRTGLHDVYVMRRDGTGVRRVTHGGGELPAWSPDGRFLVYDSERGLAIVRADGTRVRTLRLDVPVPTAFPDWTR